MCSLSLDGETLPGHGGAVAPQGINPGCPCPSPAALPTPRRRAPERGEGAPWRPSRPSQPSQHPCRVQATRPRQRLGRGGGPSLVPECRAESFPGASAASSPCVNDVIEMAEG